jgi:putative flippase GtrA
MVTWRMPQLLVFVGGGAMSAVVDIGVMQLFLMNGANAFSATSVGFLAGLGVNYIYHSRVTFKNLTSAATIARFLCVVGINYLLTLMLVNMSIALFDMPLPGKIVSLPIVAVNGFFLSKHWVFKQCN